MEGKSKCCNGVVSEDLIERLMFDDAIPFLLPLGTFDDLDTYRMEISRLDYISNTLLMCILIIQSYYV